ncbi:MFS transporter [Candidatus Thorarchaeota archaeon]|nr:MAG: MFS transporter [Candidatus Thorarchaeota archaeon]
MSSDEMIKPTTETYPIVMGGRARKVMGLNMNLWRLALVTGIAQFSMSLWAWEFSIFLELDVLLAKWQIGMAFSIGTFAMILGYMASGIISDFIGRKNTMVISFIPMAIGLLGMWLNPTWPFIAIEYALNQFGWASILVITAAIPADEIVADGGAHSARTFTMVLLPAFIVDGISPILGGIMLDSGYTASHLHIIAAIGSIIALLATALFVKESLTKDIIKEARRGPIITVRGLGKDFWKFVLGISGFIFFLRAAVPYLGNLVVGEWNISPAFYGYAWSFYSITSAIILYSAGTLADKNVKAAQILALIGNALIILVFAFVEGFLYLIVLNALWSIPVALWIGAENTIVAGSVTIEKKGRALGTYRYALSVIGLFAYSFGAYIWELNGSLKILYYLVGIGCLLFVIIMAIALRSINLKRETVQYIDEK